MKIKSGFSLIEFLIVIVILSTLSAIAIPIYQDYVVRARVMEGLAVTGPARIAIAEAVQQGVALDDIHSLSTLKLSFTPTDTISAMTVSRGVIQIAYFPQALHGNEIILTFTPSVLSNTKALSWACKTNDVVYLKYVPPNCRNI